MKIKANTNAKDCLLGTQIQQLLIDNEVENPILTNNVAQWENEEYLKNLSIQFAEFLCRIGLDLSDPSLKKTPHRAVDFFINEAFYGLNYKNFPKITTNPNTYKYSTPLISTGITVNSVCEHHLVAIFGKAIIAYIPVQKIIGLSKINRIVDFFAKRPQVQERMTRQIFISLQQILETPNIAVAINARHSCIAIREVKNLETENLTIECGGQFLTDETLKNNFYQLAFHIKL